MEMSKKENIYLYGAGGHAKVIIDILKENDIFVAEIIDDNKDLTSLLEIPIISTFKTDKPIIVSIGDNLIRKKIADKFDGVPFSKAIAKSAIISELAEIGDGSVVMQGSIIQSSVKIGKHVIVNTGATIDHDCTIGDFVHIAPGSNLCGNIEVGDGSLIGAGVIIIPGIKIGKWSVIGAGSVVTRNIPDNVIAFGSPCRMIRNKQQMY